MHTQPTRLNGNQFIFRYLHHSFVRGSRNTNEGEKLVGDTELRIQLSLLRNNVCAVCLFFGCRFIRKGWPIRDLMNRESGRKAVGQLFAHFHIMIDKTEALLKRFKIPLLFWNVLSEM